MSISYLFADEAGCFAFNRNQNVSKYFILCTVLLKDIEVGVQLQRLRHQMIYEGEKLGDYFHATTDSQAVRDRVFKVMLDYDFTVQATICEKAKAQPTVRASKAAFYKRPWFYHFEHGIRRQVNRDDHLLVTAASIGNKRERLSFTTALDDVMSQTIPSGQWAVDFRPAQCDTCLQVADYCAWAIQRKWERKDSRSYDYIKDRITREYDLWAHGKTLYY